MEKLELNHLVGYLPYGLELWHNQWKEILIMDCAGSNCDTLAIEDVIEYAKPILRPLSDLTKKIEVNGERFVPIDKIAIYGSEYYLIEQIKIGMLEVIIWQMLLEWHFDIHNLIENNLAIDINTLNKQ